MPSRPTTTFGRVDVDVLYPPFARKAERLADACARRGALIVFTSGGRTYDEQRRLFAQGRTAPGRRVTNARPGESAHNFLVALDGVTDADANLANGLQPDYTDAAYRIYGEEAERLGLEWGGRWTSIHDTPHVQLPLVARGLSLALLDGAFRRGGYAEVFTELDRGAPW